MTRTNLTLAEMVINDAASARTFDRLGIDYCCGGDETLDHACARLGLDIAAVIVQLGATPTTGDDHSCEQMSPAELIGHLVSVHHSYLHAELSDLDLLAHRVLQVHGDLHPELSEIHSLCGALRDDLEPHMLKEERVLFPAILELLDGPAQFPFGSIVNPIKMMGIEHDRAGEVLAQLRAGTHDFTLPEDACASYRSLYQRLAEVEHDTHVHVFEENHLLFPQAAELECAWAL